MSYYAYYSTEDNNEAQEIFMINKETTSSPVALITGGARRVGAVIAAKLHTAGYDVVVHCHRSYREALVLATHLNTIRPKSALVLQSFLEKESDAADLITRASAWQSRLDVLVNNASVFLRTPVQASSSASLLSTLWMTNVGVPYWLSEAAFPWLASQQGVIINLTDIHAEKPLRGYSVYCQTKAALKMQTEALAKEYAPQVRVNAVAPGAIAWPEGENTLDDAQKKAIIERTPLGCHGQPDWIAMAALALIENPFITGQTLRVDGGRSLG